MKIIKKIAAIMLSVMMVLGMCSVVGAEGTSETSATTGSITINNAAPGETYNIYRILDLESYSGKNYAYKLRKDTVSGSKKSWSDFIQSTGIKDTYVTLDGEYVTWKEGASVKDFAKVALTYAKDSTTKINPDATQKLEGTDTSVTFSGLPLGYYLVETSVGTVLALDTTKPNATIKEKNGVPSVEKRVQEDSTSEWKPSNTADIGQKVNFKTTITAQAGAKSYVLHDKMESGLTFDNSVTVTKGEQKLSAPQDYNLVVSPSTTIKDDCTFEIVFTQKFCDTLKADDEIIVTYSAILNKDATIAGDGNKNETWLKYGDKSETTHDETITKTYEIPVFKYTGTDTPLAGANFTLKKEGSSEAVSLISIETPEGKQGDFYRVAVTGETGNSTVTTGNTGKFIIQGLDAGIYYLTETKQPDGYNILKEAIKIEIDNDGNIKYASKSETLNSMPSGENVKVLNNTGSILPSTGGMGTTLFYIFGAILVIGSGVVLITKKRMK